LKACNTFLFVACIFLYIYLLFLLADAEDSAIVWEMGK
jgi:hypothetical protein